MEINVRNVMQTDLPSLRPILETWVRDRQTKELLTEEVEAALAFVQKAVSSDGKAHYRIAEVDKRVIGMIGLHPLTEPKMLSFASTSSPFEVRHFFVSAAHNNGKGVGRKLISEIEKVARELGGTELFVNSGTRYKDTAWGFYDKIFGERVAVLEKFYDNIADAVVWRKSLCKTDFVR